MHRRLTTAGNEVAPHYHQLLVLIAAVCNEMLDREPKVQASDSTFILYRTINNYSIGPLRILGIMSFRHWIRWLVYREGKNGVFAMLADGREIDLTCFFD